MQNLKHQVLQIEKEAIFSFNAAALKKEIDQDGCLMQYDVPIARSGAFDYVAFEFGFLESDGIDPNQLITVYRSDASFSDEVINKNPEIPFTNDHPEGVVNVHNSRQLRVGSVHGLYFKNGILYAKYIKVYDPDTISQIENGIKKEVSIGFEARYEFKPVVVNGVTYDGLEEVVRINHLSLVDTGKAGPQIKMHKMNKETKKMSEEKLMTVSVNGVDVLVPAEQAIQINAAKTAEMFSQVNSTLEKITNSIEQLSIAVNAKNEDAEEMKEDDLSNKKNEDEQEDKKASNKKNEDSGDDEEDKKTASENEDDEDKETKDTENAEPDEVVATKPDAVNSKNLADLMSKVIGNAQQSSKGLLASDCEISDNVYTPDFVINNSEKFDAYTVLAAFINKYSTH